MAIDPLIEPQYVFSDRYPSRLEVYRRIADASDAVRNEGPAHLDVAYGSHPRERIDLFPGHAGRPLLVFLHGGYWRSQHKDDYAYVARALRARGLSVAVVGYPLAPERPLPRIVESVRSALAWLHARGREILPAHGETVVAGHSAGGHLAAMLAINGELGSSVAGFLGLSGLYDLGPLVRTSIGDQVGIDENLAARFSPLAHAPGKGWLIAAVGADETLAFREQASRYAAHWSASGRAVSEVVVPAADHYSILLQMADEGSPVLERLFAALDAPEAV